MILSKYGKSLKIGDKVFTVGDRVLTMTLPNMKDYMEKLQKSKRTLIKIPKTKVLIFMYVLMFLKTKKW